jgi:glycosyltransferase involved in cell wall biosynthesis
MKILFVGDKRVDFCFQDVDILSLRHEVVPVYLDLMKKDYFEMIKTGIFQIIPGIWSTKMVIIWFADYHAFFVLLFSKLLRKKSIVIIGGHEVCNMPEINWGYQNRFLRGFIARWVLRNSDKIVSPSNSYAQKVFFLVHKPAAVIPNAAEPNIYSIQTTSRDFDVVMVANQYLNMKDYILLKGVAIYNAIATKLPEYRFYLIGKVDQSVKSTFTKLVYLESQSHDEVLRCLPRFKVYCQLSYTESFGVALLESIQSGCIPVVTNKDGMKELVDQNGYQIGYGDVDAGVNAVREALGPSRDRSKIMGQYRRKYSKEVRALNFENLIRSFEL